MRQGKVFVEGRSAGVITESVGEFIFEYDESYLLDKESLPVSLTLPLRKEKYVSKTLFSFFDGLIPEGWLLNIAERNWKINRHDRMGLLLTCCRDCIGNVSVLPLADKERN